MIKAKIIFYVISILAISTLLIDLTADASIYSNDDLGDRFIMDDDEEEREMSNINNSIAVIETNWGTIKFELYEERAPITTENFIKLTEEGFYDGIKFHRIIDDFVIQTGDPNTRDDNPYNDGNGGSDETIPLEIDPELTHEDGAVGMARGAEPDSASSQFYICDGAQNGLDGDYAVFGITIEGMDVVRKIAQAETYPDYRVLLKDHPVDDIVMERVYITEYEPPENLTGSEQPRVAVGSGLPGFETPASLIAIAAVTLTLSLFRKKKWL